MNPVGITKRNSIEFLFCFIHPDIDHLKFIKIAKMNKRHYLYNLIKK